MKLIIADHFRRRWFLWSFFCLTNFSIGLLLDNFGQTAPSFFYLMFAFVLGPHLWLSELQKGYPRVILGLPLTTQQIGRSLWWLLVGFASLLLAGFSLLGMISATVFVASNLNFGAWMIYVLINFFMYGTVFWLFSGAPSRPSGNWLQKTGGNFYGLMTWGLVIGTVYFFCKDGFPTPIKLTMFFLVCGTLSILGWFRAERLIVGYSESRASSEQIDNLPGRFEAPHGFGGIPFILWTAFSNVWFFGIIFLIITNLVGLFLKHEFNWHHLTQNLNWGGSFPVFFIITFSALSLSQNLRFLRTMPISSARLAAALLLVYILPLLTLCLAITALAWAETGAAGCISFFKLELLAVAPVSIFVAVSVWNTEGDFVKSVLLVIVILATLVPAFYQLTITNGRGLPFWFIILFDVVIVSISHWSTCQIIAKSSSAYRAHQNMIGNGWSWGRR